MWDNLADGKFVPRPVSQRDANVSGPDFFTLARPGEQPGDEGRLRKCPDRKMGKFSTLAYASRLVPLLAAGNQSSCPDQKIGKLLKFSVASVTSCSNSSDSSSSPNLTWRKEVRTGFLSRRKQS